MRRGSRRRPLPEPLERATEEIEQAQRALLAAVPRPRDDGVPLGAALAAFTAALRRAQDAIERWDHPACGDVARSLTAALEAGDALRLQPGGLSFSALNDAIGDVLAPLEDVAEIERGLREGRA